MTSELEALREENARLKQQASKGEGALHKAWADNDQLRAQLAALGKENARLHAALVAREQARERVVEAVRKTKRYGGDGALSRFIVEALAALDAVEQTP
jgi:chromosome segregation ATPase